MDDLPVGGATNKNGADSGTNMDEYANPNGGASGGGLGTQAADSSGPLEQRIVSKNW